MKNNVIFLTGLIISALTVHCFAGQGHCSESQCSGKISYVKINAEGTHFIALDASHAEYKKLGCKADNDRYIAIADSADKNKTISSVFAAYREDSPVTVYVRQGANSCEVKQFLLSQK